jgi:hypothetical protein
VRPAPLVAALVLTLAACSTPEGDPSEYHDEALSTLKTAHSAVETVRITLGVRLEDRTFGRAADDAITGAEESLSSTAGTFEGLQPPPGADKIRDAATSLLSDAQDAVEAARIAVRRDDRGRMRDALAQVAKVSKDLDSAPEKLR